MLTFFLFSYKTDCIRCVCFGSSSVRFVCEVKLRLTAANSPADGSDRGCEGSERLMEKGDHMSDNRTLLICLQYFSNVVMIRVTYYL